MSDETAQIINYVVWAIAIGIFAWLIVDALRIETTYDRDLLVSSREGEIEKEIQADHHDSSGRE